MPIRIHRAALPASGYSDNALWQAGRLSIDAFLRFGQERDKNTGIRLLRLLTTEYPTSKLAARERVGGPPSSPRVGGAYLWLAAGAAPAERLATIREIRREVLADAVRITIELDHEVAFHEERIPIPVRVFLDLPSTRAAPALVDKTLRFDGDDDIVRQVRIGRHPNTTTRVVLDAAGVSSYSVYPLGPYDPSSMRSSSTASGSRLRRARPVGALPRRWIRRRIGRSGTPLPPDVRSRR